VIGIVTADFAVAGLLFFEVAATAVPIWINRRLDVARAITWIFLIPN
jgi:hypothetical protein